MGHSTFWPISFTKCAKLLLVSLISLARVNGEGKVMLTIVEDRNNKLNIEYFGSKVNVIDDEEAARFGLAPEEVCVEKIGRVKGQNPDYCYLKGEVHRRFLWPDVQSIYVVQEVTLRDDFSTPALLHREFFENVQGFDTTIKVYIKTEIYDSIEHQTYKNNTFELGGSVSVVYRAFTGSVDTAYEHTWGHTEKKTHRKTVEIGASSETVLGPHSNLTVELSGLQKTAVFDITYQNYITGVVVGDYYYKYKNHHYHGMDVERLLPMSSLVQTYTERLRIDHYQAEHMKLIRDVPEDKPPTVRMMQQTEIAK